MLLDILWYIKWEYHPCRKSPPRLLSGLENNHSSSFGTWWGELVKPKNITGGSYNPWFVINAAFYSSPSRRRTLSCPNERQIWWSILHFEVYQQFPKSMVNDIGFWFSWSLISRIGRNEPSFPSTKKNGEALIHVVLWVLSSYHALALFSEGNPPRDYG